jgi:hypothetical protein
MEHMRDDGDGLLLIYDNAVSADALVRWLPRGGVWVIVTSNDHAWRGVAAVAIEVWSANIGADFLIARAYARPCSNGPLPLVKKRLAADIVSPSSFGVAMRGTCSIPGASPRPCPSPRRACDA